MSNILYVTVGYFVPLDQPDNESLVVLARDLYGADVLTFDNEEHLINCYPTKEDLVAYVIKMPAFRGAASLNKEGKYVFDAVDNAVVQGFPQ